MYKIVVAIAALLVWPGFAINDCFAQRTTDSRTFYETHQSLAGVYQTNVQSIVVGLIASADIIYFQLPETGDIRFMEKDGDSLRYRYSPTRNITDETEGRVSFVLNSQGNVANLKWTAAEGAETIARRLPGHTEKVRFSNGDEAVLHGSLMVPEGTGPFPAVVVIPQADRSDLSDVGMWLFSRGMAVLLYDQRNNELGLSTGKEVTGRYQDQQQVHAHDAMAAVRFLRAREEIVADQVGVVGWSGGGLIGAMVAGADPDLGFYVNIAGDASPGFEQASHMFVARLMREGFSDAEVESSRHLVSLHFGVAEGRVKWEDYQTQIADVEKTKWYQYLTNRYSIPFTKKEGVLEIGRYQDEWPPSRVYGQITSVPTLGVFFEFDHSSGPSSPDHFYRSLRAAGNSDFAVAMIPDANHGGFELDGMGYRFDTSKLKRRSPLLASTISDWIERHVGVR